ncbi:hypothetical protein N7468_009879 [Penicillium chermesinum]|uniref:Uncharacterized protein n=1 Tax=Penicillium chermesinum TaxID=63820 RepID=A0A9W9TBZ3_9EURO|nr:uncharacterized protein N7468_009852 [Penicillium chermesinum]XP_058325742.1 uncharacterized protein N7468_009879 [Penicillium chermesinum]KAJ5216844.1 hypothetical protein N7468_009852 [Penicillium chermesinum]KAJ5216871.1 hypothetical protein N7468_009879 [Penicillium chermesinum]KAJ6171511.1 hypothetical protein N7470_000578 [Penicillium chermesinum]KAJ6171539.1 hypothetical protein N7470_000606 [Penicillium chermesinum]
MEAAHPDCNAVITLADQHCKELRTHIAQRERETAEEISNLKKALEGANRDKRRFFEEARGWKAKADHRQTLLDNTNRGIPLEQYRSVLTDIFNQASSVVEVVTTRLAEAGMVTFSPSPPGFVDDDKLRSQKGDLYDLVDQSPPANHPNLELSTLGAQGPIGIEPWQTIC